MAEAKKRVVAIIPARGGSQSIPLKNIKELAGRPLIDWCIKAARDSGIFSEIYVSTDHDKIAEVAEACGAKVHRRSVESATNTASTELAMTDFTKAHPDYDILCLIQATSPLVTPEHFQEAMKTFTKVGADSLVTAVRAHRFLWKVKDDGEAEAINYTPAKRPRRQDWNGELIENGAFYFTTNKLFEETQCRLGGKIALYEMPEHTLCELDSMVDWEITKGLVEQHGHHVAK
jgi:N-acylneuraminate cytidylyltransferase